MKEFKRIPGDWLKSARGGRRPGPTTVLLVLLAGMLVITSLTAGATSAGNQQKYQEKGTNAMQPSAAALRQDLPRLDVTLPSRVETFTFGLG